MDPSNIAKPAAQFIIRRLLALTPSAKMEEARRRMLDDMITDTSDELRKIEARVGNLEEPSEEHLVTAVNRLVPEALSSMTRERRRMMAAALAGLAWPDYSAEKKSRIIRAVAALEPSDVIHLRLFDDQHGVNQRADAIPDAVRARWASGGRGEHYELVALEATGCLMRPDTFDRGHLMTQLGKDVLAYLRHWNPEA